MLEDYQDYLTPREVQMILGVSATTVYELMKSKQIPAFKLGKKMWRIPKQSLVDYLSNVLHVND